MRILRSELSARPRSSVPASLGEQQAVADGKRTANDLHILMNWQKQGSEWKLLSRSATRLG